MRWWKKTEEAQAAAAEAEAATAAVEVVAAAARGPVVHLIVEPAHLVVQQGMSSLAARVVIPRWYRRWWWRDWQGRLLYSILSQGCHVYSIYSLDV